MALSPNQAFKYDHLDKDGLRLMQILPGSTATDIRCSLVTIPDFFWAAQEIEYAALSYCWGSVELNQRITLNNESFAITSNLHEALSSIIQHHHSTGRYYWVDAICIDQSNVQERNEQVHQMWRIYSQAHVLSWLGPEDEDTETAFAIMREMAKVGMPEPGQCCNPSLFPVIEFFDQGTKKVHSVLSRDYFTRTWIIPEFLQAASKLQILCGRHSCDVTVLSYLECGWRKEFGRRPLASGLWANHSRSEKWRDQAAILKLLGILHSYADTVCTDPRDRVFALLSDPRTRELDPHGYLKPDYRLTPGQLALAFVEYCDRLRALNIDDFKIGELEYFLQNLLVALNVALGTSPDLDELGKSLIGEVWITEHGAFVWCDTRTFDCSGQLMRLLWEPVFPSPILLREDTPNRYQGLWNRLRHK